MTKCSRHCSALACQLASNGLTTSNNMVLTLLKDYTAAVVTTDQKKQVVVEKKAIKNQIDVADIW